MKINCVRDQHSKIDRGLYFDEFKFTNGEKVLGFASYYVNSYKKNIVPVDFNPDFNIGNVKGEIHMTAYQAVLDRLDSIYHLQDYSITR